MLVVTRENVLTKAVVYLRYFTGKLVQTCQVHCLCYIFFSG